MRRSLAVKLTMLPMLASAAVAAQPAPTDEPPASTDEPSMQAPGETEPMLSPPGLTPTLDECQVDPGDPPCPPEEEEPLPESEDGYPRGIFGGPIRIRGHRHHHHHGVFRGGFGHYAMASGG